MKAVEFGSLFEFIRNGMSVRQDKSGDGLPITRIETISEAVVDSSRVGFAGLEEKDCNGWLLQPGDILFSHINSVEHIGKCAVYEGSPEKLVHGMNLLCLRPDKSKLTPQFGKYLIRSNAFRSRLFNYVNKAVNQASVSIGNLKPIEVSVPSLPEQKRIAAILDKADSIRRKRQEAVRMTEDLLRSVFLEIFGDPVTNPKGWKSVKLGDIALKVTDGEHQTPKRTSEGIKLLSARNIQNGFIDVTDVDYVGIEEHERIKQRCNPTRGDILISCSGTIGRVTTVEIDEPFSLVRSVAMVKPKTDLIDSKYLEHYLRTTALHRIMQNNANSSSQANLFQNQIRDLPICLPPRDIQKKFTVNISAIEKVLVLHNKALTDHDALFRSLLQSAFKGSYKI
jgi:type I restriction enzyme S subunit